MLLFKCPLCNSFMIEIVMVPEVLGLKYCYACWTNNIPISVVFDEKCNIWKYNGIDYTDTEMIRLSKLKAFL